MKPLATMIVLALGSLLPAQTSHVLGLFPDAIQAVQPGIDRVLRLSEEQEAKIAGRCAPLRTELAELESQVAAAEGEARTELIEKLEVARAELEPVLRSTTMSVLSEPQKQIVARLQVLHARAAAAAAADLGRLAQQGESAKLDLLVRQHLLGLCPGLDAAQLDQVEAALLAAFERTKAPLAAAAPPVGGEKRSMGSALLAAIAGGALEKLEQTKSSETKDVLGSLAEGAAKAAAGKLTESLVDKLAKKKK